jgi:hypothetical protein
MKCKTCDIRTWGKDLFSTNIDTLVPSLYQWVETRSTRSLLTVVSATSAPPFQPLRHPRNVCHQGGCLAGQTDEVSRGQVRAVRRMFKTFQLQFLNSLLSCSVCMRSCIVMMKQYSSCQLAWMFSAKTSQYDAKFTFSPGVWEWANSTPWEPQNTVSINFPADGVWVYCDVSIALKHALIRVGGDAPMIRPQYK